jgi:hypothetical protein
MQSNDAEATRLSRGYPSRIWEPLPFDTPPPLMLSGPVLRCIYELQFIGRLRLIRLAQQKQFEPTDDGRRVLFESVPTIALLAEFYKTQPNHIMMSELRGALSYLLQNEYVEPYNLPLGAIEVDKGRYVDAELALPHFQGHDGRHVGRWDPFPPFEFSAIPKELLSIHTESSFRASLSMAPMDRAILDAVIVNGEPIYWAFRRYELLTGTIYSSPALTFCLGYPARMSVAPTGENFKIARRGSELVEKADNHHIEAKHIKWVSAVKATEFANRLTGVKRDWPSAWRGFCIKHGVEMRDGLKRDGTPSKSRREVNLFSLTAAILRHSDQFEKMTPDQEKRRAALTERIRRDNSFSDEELKDLWNSD